MSKFLTPLITECIDDTLADGRGVWRVTENFSFQSDVLKAYYIAQGKSEAEAEKLSIITVEIGFLTDYASVPRLPFVYWLLGDSSHKAAVLHDWLFHHHEVCDEQTANNILLEASAVEGIPAWRRTGIYLGVKVGGESSWEADGKGNGHSIVDGVIT